MRLFKILGSAGESIHGGACEWSLPRGKRPGGWMPPVTPRLCESGYHVVRAWCIPEWSADGCAVYEAETRGAVDGDPAGAKVAAESCRLVRRVQWDERVARLYAADCAAYVYHLSGQDPRTAAAIVAARRFARGEIERPELAAAGAAAWTAAWTAARAAAWTAAGAAARAAAGAAARAAAEDAARAAARDAAEDAARDAARAAAGAAARAAAWTAAGAAAWDAAWAAEIDLQERRLLACLDGRVKRKAVQR